jgi:hypothetical protein
MGRILVYAQFDLDAFFQAAADANIQLSLFIGKKTVEDKQGKLLHILKNPRAYGVKARFSNGRELKLVSSLLLSVYSQLVGPAALLDFIKSLDNIQQGVQ